jgi:hypothetical protein
MSNRRTHLIGGTAAGLALAGYLARNERPSAFVAETVGGALGGALGCLGPDTAEPAVHSWHRSVAHSYTTAATIATATVLRVQHWQEYCRARATSHDEAIARSVTDGERLWHGFMALVWRVLSGFLAGLPAGYLSHLALDAFTPRGIPLLA